MRLDCRRIGRLKTHDSRKGWALPSRIQTLLLQYYPFFNIVASHLCYHWVLQPGLWRALLRQVGAWVLSLHDLKVKACQARKSFESQEFRQYYCKSGCLPCEGELQRVPERAATSQAAVRPTIPERAGLSP